MFHFLSYAPAVQRVRNDNYEDGDDASLSSRNALEQLENHVPFCRSLEPKIL